MIKKIFLSTILMVGVAQSASADPSNEQWWKGLPISILPNGGLNLPMGGGVSVNPSGISADVDPAAGGTVANVETGQKTGGFDIFELMSTTIGAMPDCIDYCITGVQFRLDFTTLIIAALIRHNNADLLLEVYPSLAPVSGLSSIPGLSDNQEDSTGPWQDWSSVMGVAQYNITRSWALSMYSVLGFDGGVQSQAGYGETQTHGFKEGHVIGHPYVLIPYLLDRTTGELREECIDGGTVSSGESYDPGASDFDTTTERETGPSSAACLENLPGNYQNTASEELLDNEPDPVTGEDPDWWDQTPEELANDAVEHITTGVGDYITRIEACVYDLRCVLTDVLDSPEFQRIFSLLDAIEQSVETIKDATEVIQTVVDVAKLITTGGIGYEIRLDRILCPSEEITALMPYYLSGIDPQWRSGLIDVPPQSFPNDPHMIATILNPLSADRVGERNELWGHIYPRSGIYNHSHDAKAGMLITKRLEGIVTEPQRRRLRLNAQGLPPSEDEWLGKYQMIYPFEQSTCEVEPWVLDERPHNIHGDFMYPGKEQRYAFNYWREHACGTSTKGSKLYDLEIPEICL